MRAERVLSPFRAPPEFTPRPRRDFRAYDLFVSKPRRIAQPQPDEVGQLVDENPRKLGTGAIQRDSTFAEKRPRMYRPTTVPQSAHDIHSNRCAV